MPRCSAAPDGAMSVMIAPADDGPVVELLERGTRLHGPKGRRIFARTRCASIPIKTRLKSDVNPMHADAQQHKSNKSRCPCACVLYVGALSWNAGTEGDRVRTNYTN